MPRGHRPTFLKSERRRLCGLHGPRQHNCLGGKPLIRSHALYRFRAVPNQAHAILKSLRRVLIASASVARDGTSLERQCPEAMPLEKAKTD
jgi:hypothetical protein